MKTVQRKVEITIRKEIKKPNKVTKTAQGVKIKLHNVMLLPHNIKKKPHNVKKKPQHVKKKPQHVTK